MAEIEKKNIYLVTMIKKELARLGKNPHVLV